MHLNLQCKEALGPHFVPPHITKKLSSTRYFCICNVLMLDVMTASIESHFSLMYEFIDRNSITLKSCIVSDTNVILSRKSTFLITQLNKCGMLRLS